MDIIISKDSVGYDISVFSVDGDIIKTAWANTLSDARFKASIIQGYYRDSEGQIIKITDKITSTE